MTTNVAAPAGYQGNDKLLFGIIMGVIAFWLFAQTTLNIAPGMSSDLGISANTMNIAVAITALFSGIFIIVVGGLADRVGRMKVVRIGFYLNIIGSLLVGLTPTGDLATPVLLVGRALQGLSAACIMPASLAVVKTYWDGAGRQRAVTHVVDRLLGRLGPVLDLRRPDDGAFRLALDLLRLDRGLRAGSVHDPRHAREQG